MENRHREGYVIVIVGVMTEPVVYRDGPADLRRYADTIEAAYRDVDLALPPSCELAGYVRSARSVAQVLALQSGVDVSKHKELVWRSLECRKIAEAVVWCLDTRGLGERLRWMLKSFQGGSSGHSKASDFCFEVLTLASFERSGYPAVFSEPDVVIKLDSERLSIACKRVYKEPSLRTRVKKAKRQISKHDRRGIIALDLSPLFAFEKLPRFDDVDSFKIWLEGELMRFRNANELSLARWIEGEDFNRKVLGLMFYVHNPVILRKERQITSVDAGLIANRCREGQRGFQIMKQISASFRSTSL